MDVSVAGSGRSSREEFRGMEADDDEADKESDFETDGSGAGGDGVVAQRVEEGGVMTEDTVAAACRALKLSCDGGGSGQGSRSCGGAVFEARGLLYTTTTSTRAALLASGSYSGAQEGAAVPHLFGGGGGGITVSGLVSPHSSPGTLQQQQQSTIACRPANPLSSPPQLDVK
jgi:hypothetical protein